MRTYLVQGAKDAEEDIREVCAGLEALADAADKSFMQIEANRERSIISFHEECKLAKEHDVVVICYPKEDPRHVSPVPLVADVIIKVRNMELKK